MNKDVTLNEVLEFLQEHMVTREEAVTKADLSREVQRIFDHVDRKIDEVKGDLVALVRQEDHKLNATVNALKERKGLDVGVAETILKMPPFSHTV